MPKKEREEAKETTNRSVYNKTIKEVHVNDGELSCSYCRYNKGENSTQGKRSPKKPKTHRDKG